jgi:hypothetical protein
MPVGVITLADVAARTDTLDVACKSCERAGRYAVAALVKRYGRRTDIPDLLRKLSANCSHQQSVRNYDLCGVYCPGLAHLFTIWPKRSG